MKIETIKIYEFSELDEKAQAKVLDKFREYALYDNWHESIYDDAKQIAECLGVTIENIYFTGFSFQGDGACFTGFYTYKADASHRIREYAPKDETLHAIADDLTTAGKEGVTAHIAHRGNYYHEMSMDIEYDDTEYTETFDAGNERQIEDALRRFAKWIYRALESEADYRQSDIALREEIRANGYEFLADGSPAPRYEKAA